MKIQTADFAVPTRSNPSATTWGLGLLLLVGVAGGAYWWMSRSDPKAAALAWAKQKGIDGIVDVRVEGSAGAAGTTMRGERGDIPVEEGDQIVSVRTEHDAVVLLVRKSGEVVFVMD